MFTGLINNISKLHFIKYFNKIVTVIFIKSINYEILNINIGESISIDGVCLTLIYKNFIFLEFELSKETLINIKFLENNEFLNLDKSLNFYSNLNGYINLGHINNFFYLIDFLKFYKNYKISMLTKKKFYKFFLYKNSLNLNGINLTLNEIEYNNNYIILSFNLINYTYKFTSFKNIKLLDKINLELDINFFYLFKHICTY